MRRLEDRSRSSDVIVGTPIRKGLVTIAGHLSDDIAKGTLNNVLKQTGLKEGGSGNLFRRVNWNGLEEMGEK